MEPTKELADALFRDKVEMAKRMSLGERLESGIELFEFAADVSRAGIRHQFPKADDTEVERMLRERISLGERLHDRGIYKVVEVESAS